MKIYYYIILISSIVFVSSLLALDVMSYLDSLLTFLTIHTVSVTILEL